MERGRDAGEHKPSLLFMPLDDDVSLRPDQRVSLPHVGLDFPPLYSWLDIIFLILNFRHIISPLQELSRLICYSVRDEKVTSEEEERASD